MHNLQMWSRAAGWIPMLYTVTNRRIRITFASVSKEYSTKKVLNSYRYKRSIDLSTKTAAQPHYFQGKVTLKGQAQITTKFQSPESECIETVTNQRTPILARVSGRNTGQEPGTSCT